MVSGSRLNKPIPACNWKKTVCGSCMDVLSVRHTFENAASVVAAYLDAMLEKPLAPLHRVCFVLSCRRLQAHVCSGCRRLHAGLHHHAAPAVPVAVARLGQRGARASRPARIGGEEALPRREASFESCSQGRNDSTPQEVPSKRGYSCPEELL